MRVPRSTRPLVMLADSEDLAGVWGLGALAAFVVSAAGAGALAFALYQTIQITWLDALVGLLLTIGAHQAVHAGAIAAMRGRPRVVWGWHRLVPYLHIAGATRLSRTRTFVSLLAPLVVVDLAGLALLLVPATSGIGLAIVVANTTGSIPDLWRAGRLARLPGWVQCELRGATMVIWAPAEHDAEAAGIGSGRLLRAPRVLGVLGTWAFCLLVAEALCAGAVRLFAQWHGALRVGGVLLASTEQFVSGPDVVLNLVPVLVAGATLGTLGAAAWVLSLEVTSRARRPPHPPHQAALPGS